MKLEILEQNLKFPLDQLKQGALIKVPEWKGFWFLEGGVIKVRDYTGAVLTTEPWYHTNILREDWQIVEQNIDFNF